LLEPGEIAAYHHRIAVEPVSIERQPFCCGCCAASIGNRPDRALQVEPTDLERLNGLCMRAIEHAVGRVHRRRGGLADIGQQWLALRLGRIAAERLDQIEQLAHRSSNDQQAVGICDPMA